MVSYFSLRLLEVLFSFVVVSDKLILKSLQHESTKVHRSGSNDSSYLYADNQMTIKRDINWNVVRHWECVAFDVGVSLIA